jgi:hypothetical protein
VSFGLQESLSIWVSLVGYLHIIWISYWKFPWFSHIIFPWKDVEASLMCTVVILMLNPSIYSLRNMEIRRVLWRLQKYNLISFLFQHFPNMCLKKNLPHMPIIYIFVVILFAYFAGFHFTPCSICV